MVKKIKNKILILIIISILILTSATPYFSVSADYENEYEPQVGAPDLYQYILSTIDNNGCISLAYTNQSDTHMRYKFSLSPDMTNPLIYWDNTSMDIGGGNFRYESQDMSNTLNENATYYYNFTAHNGTNQALNTSVNGTLILWSPNLTLNAPNDGIYNVDPTQPYEVLNISATTPFGDEFNVTFWEGYYYAASLLNSSNHSVNGTFTYNYTNATQYGTRYRWCAKVETCFGQIKPDGIGFETTRSIWTKKYSELGEGNNWTFWTENDTITISLVNPLDINIGNITESNITWNISSKGTAIDPTTLLFARTATYDDIARNATFYVPRNPFAPNVTRGHGRNLGYWFEKFNTSGSGELGGIGEWSCGAQPNSSKFNVFDSGSNWSLVSVTPCSCALFPKFWYLDRKQIMHEDKTDQYISIYNDNMIKTQFDMTGITSEEYAWNNNWKNATHHIFFYANATSGDSPLNVWFANKSYTSGHPLTSEYCTFLGSVSPGEDYSYSLSNSKYYNLTFATNNGSIGGINLTTEYTYIFTSDAAYDDAWKLYYADDNATAGDGYFDFKNTSVAQSSTNNGSTWYDFGNDTTDDKVLRLNFNEGSGDNLVDSSGIRTGHYHNGTRHGATWNASGHDGEYCLDFNGTTDYVNVSNDPDGHLNFTDEMSISLWVNPAQLASADYWISKEDSFRFGTGADKNRPRFGFYRAGWKDRQSDTDLLFDGDIWYHVGVTFNVSEPETIIYYINGTEVDREVGFTGSGLFEPGFGDIYIGLRYGLTAGFDGSIDDVRLWNRSLSPDEMYDVYTNITRQGTPDVNFNVANGDNDKVYYKLYAETTADNPNGTWSQTWQDVIGEENLPPNSITITAPTVNGTYYASDNITILFKWLGDPNYDDCWMNTTIEDGDGTYVADYNNRFIPGWYQKTTDDYDNWIIPTDYNLQGGQYRFNVTIEDNQSLSTTDYFPFKISEVNGSTPIPSNDEDGVHVPLTELQFSYNNSYNESYNVTVYLWFESDGYSYSAGPWELTGNGTSGLSHSHPYWGSNYSSRYQWMVSYEYEGNSPHWRNYTYAFVTESNPLANWTFLPGYDNCTNGTPDFDQKQSDWYSVAAMDKWCCDGPVAALNALWWLDCKAYNGTSQSRLEDWYGAGSHSPQNVIPLVDSLICNMSTEFGLAVLDRIGTNSSNFTRGLYRMFNNWSINDTMKMEIEGETDAGVLSEPVNWSNITSHIDQGHAIVLLLGQYCYDGIGFGNRLGGHYVTCNGYRNDTSGPYDGLYLSFADPYYDRNETGWYGWNTTHNHNEYGNGSHNWTHNLSYDFYEINTSSVWAGNTSEVVNYTSKYDNFSLMNWFGSKYASESGCDAPSENRTLIEMAWYIWAEDNITANTTVWNSSANAWQEDMADASIGTHEFNLTLKNTGGTLSSNLTIFTSHYDCLSYYIPNSARIMYPNGTWSLFEPTRSWEDETCAYAGHGHLTWCINSSNLTEFGLNDTIHILYNMSYNCTNYSKVATRIYECSNGYACQNCISYYDDMWNATNCSLGRQFDYGIICPTNTSEYGDWVLSEHIKRGDTCLDEDWSESETEFGAWAPYNSSWDYEGTWKDWEWVYKYNTEYGVGDSLGLSYTIANDTCMNRSQSLVRMKYNVTNWGDDMPEDAFDPMVGVIYSYTNDSEYHMVLYAYQTVFLLSKIGDHLYNTNDTSLVTSQTDAYNYFNMSWPCNQTDSNDPFSPYEDDTHNGIWSKVEWNPYCGRISVKGWNITSDVPFGLCEEPSGWMVDDYANYIKEQDVTKGIDGGMDDLGEQIYKVIDVWQGGTHYTESGFTGPGDFTWDGSYINWSPLGSEPVTDTQYSVKYITWNNVSMFKNNSCFGLVTWNPSKSSGVEFFAYFDFIDVWKNNFTIPNHERQYYEDGSYYNHTMPKVNFKTFPYVNYTDYYQTWNTSYDWPYHNGTLSSQEYADGTAIFYRQISKMYDINSRYFKCNRSGTCSNEFLNNSQNDTLYYYTGLAKDLSGYTTETDYNNALILEIIDTSDGHDEWHDGSIVCIDVDNNSDWDENDYCFVWWNALGQTQYFIWKGTELVDSGYNSSENYSAWFRVNESTCPYDWSPVGSLDAASNALLPSNHRYSNHVIYSLMFPPALLVKSNGEFLNVSDEFGISIATVNVGPEEGVPDEDNKVVVWQDWNETYCKNNYLDENGSLYWSYFMNISNATNMEDFYIYGNQWCNLSDSEIKYFGFAQMGNESGYLNQSYYGTNTTVTENVTTLTNISEDQLVEYNVTICNTESWNLTNVTFNFTLPSGAEMLNANGKTYWSPSSNYYVVNATNWLNTTNCTSVLVLVNYTANSQPNGSVVDVRFYSDALQPSSSSNDDAFFTYGENTAPVFNWTYPSNESTNVDLILNNISCYIYDDDGDNMDIYFYTNKSGMGNQSDAWTSTWYCIGENKTVGNGHYWWNQTTNLSNRFNTKWRWGGTTYHFWLNVTDGNVWVNESFKFTTEGSRYDVNWDSTVNVFDLNLDWASRSGVQSYLGVYDVDGDSTINVFDLNAIWANRS